MESDAGSLDKIGGPFKCAGAREQASAAVSALSLLACTMKASAAVVKSSVAYVKQVAEAVARHSLAGPYTSAQNSSTPW